MNFGENLKRLRKEKNISQEKLAEKVGVSRQSVSKWETGDAYPEMSNILALCSIFRCNINDLVNDNIIDLNSLDDEIKMSVVKFKEKEQKKMKGLSKAIYIIARILKILSVIGLIVAFISTIASLVFIPNIKFNQDKKIVKIFNQEYNYILGDYSLSIDIDNEEISIIAYDKYERNIVIDNVIKSTTSYKIAFVLSIVISFQIYMFVLFKVLSYIEKLFININQEDTPFSLINVTYIRKIALYIILAIVTQDLFCSLAMPIFNIELGNPFNITNYIVILVVLALSYIFKYGYEIQLDSKGKIYGNIENN